MLNEYPPISLSTNKQPSISSNLSCAVVMIYEYENVTKSYLTKLAIGAVFIFIDGDIEKLVNST